MKDEIPRRNRLDKLTPSEKSIYEAMQMVEREGADVRLTEAIIFLAKARELVADYIDSKTQETTLDDSQPDNPPKEPAPGGN